MSDKDHLYQIGVTKDVAGFGEVIAAVQKFRYHDEASDFRHAYFVLPQGIVQANPGGVKWGDHDSWGEDILYTEFDWTVEQKILLLKQARHEIGKPYDYFDDFVIGMYDLTRPATGSWFWKMVEEELEHDGAWECAALADFLVTKALKLMNEQFFNDGRPSHAVSPGDIAREILRRQGTGEWSRG